MSKEPESDLAAAHKFFSTNCFNAAWELIDKKGRTPEDDEQMIQRCLASIWHWSQREDCTKQSMSIGYWQASRVYAVIGQADNARRYGQLCLNNSAGEPPFYQAYAYEALARAESVAGNSEKMKEYRQKAYDLAENIVDAKAKKYVTDDLATLEG
jgi:hypothetical protein